MTEEKPRLLMAFRADEVSEGDYLTLPFGPAEVTAIERTGMTITLTARIDTVVKAESGIEHISSRYESFTPMAHELVCLWEKR